MTSQNLRRFGFDTQHPVYVIAEIGINHGGDLDQAKRLIESAAKTGCDAVKFQTYLSEQRAPEGASEILEILKKCELPFEDFGVLKSHAEDFGLDFSSTPFDQESLNYLNSIGMEIIKIASFDVVNHALLRSVAEAGKTVVMSVGMANREEIRAAYEILNRRHSKVAILHCISSYPLDPSEARLSAIPELKNMFDCVIGYSDHTPDIDVPTLAVAAGAQVIEKHYRIDGEMDCIDAAVSITEAQMKAMIERIRQIEVIFGEPELGLRATEQPISQFRRFVS